MDGTTLVQAGESPPTLVLAGSTAGVGKTTLTLGIAALLGDAGHTVATLKLGPDLLDPVLHASVTGRRGGNLDAWMMTREQNIDAFHRAADGAAVAIVEGVMGLFDGRDGVSEDGSTAQMAKWLGAPVVLVVDCDGQGRSAAAVVRGYVGFDPSLRIAGIILNRLSGPGQLRKLQDALTAAGVDVPVLGGVLKDEVLESVRTPPAGCLEPPRDLVARISSLVGGSLNPDALMDIARGAEVPPLPQPARQLRCSSDTGSPLRVGVAWDDAFCCYYNTNLSMLSEAGAELVLFSPLSNRLPPSLSAVYIGGGSPELHAEALARNTACSRALRAFAAAGGVVYAEGGGLLYLGDSILAPGQALPCPAVGIFPFLGKMAGSRTTMGYVEVESKGGASFLPSGLRVRGHVLHHNELLQPYCSGSGDDPATDQAVPLSSSTSSGGSSWRDAYKVQMGVEGAASGDSDLLQGAVEGFSVNNTLASQVHLHWGSEPRVAAAFLEASRKVDVAAVQEATTKAEEEDREASEDGQMSSSSLGNGAPSREGSRSVDHEPPQERSSGLPPVSEEAPASVARSSGSSDHHHRSARVRNSWSSTAERPLAPPGGFGAEAGIGRSDGPTIASLLPSGTEILFALGLQDRLVGVSSLCDFPPEAASFPVVVKLKVDTANLTPGQVAQRMQAMRRSGESPLQVDDDLLRRLGPKLILAEHVAGMRASSAGGAAVALSDAPLSSRHGARPLSATTLLLRPRTVADVLETITQVGFVAGVPDRAGELVDHLRRRIRDVALQVASSVRPRPKVVLIQGVSPVVLGGFWLPDVKAMAGGVDPLQEPGDDTQAVDWEVIRSSMPDVLIICPRASTLQHSLLEVCALAEMPGWWSLPAVRNGEVYVCQQEYFVRPGPRLVDGIEMLGRILHPEAVKGKIPRDRALKLTLSGGRRCRQSLLHNYFEPFS